VRFIEELRELASIADSYLITDLWPDPEDRVGG
jgi:hypothetical protein